MGVISSKNDNKVYMIPVTAKYQFQQEIKGFKEKYGAAEDNEAIKQMTHMERKALIAGSFQTPKAQRQTASLITNKVSGEGVTNREGKGARDETILKQAQLMDQVQRDNKKFGETSANSRRQAYSKESLLPEEILSLIPYKQTYEAL